MSNSMIEWIDKPIARGYRDCVSACGTYLIIDDSPFSPRFEAYRDGKLIFEGNSLEDAKDACAGVLKKPGTREV